MLIRVSEPPPQEAPFASLPAWMRLSERIAGTTLSIRLPLRKFSTAWQLPPPVWEITYLPYGGPCTWRGGARHFSPVMVGESAWKIPWTEELGGLYSSWGHKQLDTTERLTHTHTLHMPKLLLLHWKVSFTRLPRGVRPRL